MKTLMFAVLMMSSIAASAAEGGIGSDTVAQIEHYNYSQSLDVKGVIKMSTASEINLVCGPVEAHMIYLDSIGVKHNLEYEIMGYGCQNG